MYDQQKAEEKAKLDKETEERSKVFKELRRASEHHPDTPNLVLIYNKINDLVLNNKLPPGNKSIGCVTSDEYRKITSDNKEVLGATFYDRKVSDLFICVLTENHDERKKLFDTVIHEMIHAVHSIENTGGSAHGNEFKKTGKWILSILKEKQKVFLSHIVPSF